MSVCMAFPLVPLVRVLVLVRWNVLVCSAEDFPAKSVLLFFPPPDTIVFGGGSHRLTLRVDVFVVVPP